VLDDADYTPNPGRSIRIDGEINEALEDRLRPEILELTAGSRAPITVFIDSAGGRTAVGERILGLLRATNQDGESPCRLITIALSRAKSTAADILSAGDFAIADPGSKLLYHGTRITAPEAVTADYASLLAEVLKTSNRRFAASFLDKSAQRFMFFIAAFRDTFEAHRANANHPTLTDLECFQELLCQKATPGAGAVLRQAGSAWLRRGAILTHFLDAVAKVRPCGDAADIERIMLDASIAFEYQNNKADGRSGLRTGGLRRINEHFFFLDAYFRSINGVRFAELCGRGASLALTKDELDALSTEERAEQSREYFLPFWSFFAEICEILQQSEHELTALDAFWLGLIDTVRPDLAALAAPTRL
jgi:ATP-dependent protease ClpP protease subunit